MLVSVSFLHGIIVWCKSQVYSALRGSQFHPHSWKQGVFKLKGFDKANDQRRPNQDKRPGEILCQNLSHGSGHLCKRDTEVAMQEINDILHVLDPQRVMTHSQ